MAEEGEEIINININKNTNNTYTYHYVKEIVKAYSDTENAIFCAKRAGLDSNILKSLKSVEKDIYALIGNDNNSLVLAKLIYNTDMYFSGIAKHTDIYISRDTVDTVNDILNLLKEYKIDNFAIDLISFGEYLGKFLNVGYVVDKVSPSNDSVLFLKKKKEDKN